MKIRKLAAVLTAAVVALAVPVFANSAEAAESVEEKAVTMGLTMINSTDDIFATMIADVQRLGAEDGVNVLINDAGNDAIAQANAIDNFIAANCDVILVQAVDPGAVEGALQKARDAGIYIVDVFVPCTIYDAKYGNDSQKIGTAIGTMAAEYLVDKYGTEETIPVGIFESTQTTSTAERAEYVRKTLAELAPNIEIVDAQFPTTTDDGNMFTTNMLTAHPEIKAIISNYDVYAVGAYPAIKAMGLQDQVDLFGADGNQVALSYIAEGGNYIGTAALNSKSFGKDIYDMGMALVRQEEGAYEDRTTTPVIVTKENIDEWYTPAN